MYRYSPTLWSLWPALSTLNHLFVAILAVITVYSLVSAAVVMKRAHTLATDTKSARAFGSIHQSLGLLNLRCENLRQILTATFYLFGLLLFVSLKNATTTVGDGRELPVFQILNNFVFEFIFAANVFFVFLILHFVQWLTSNRLQACTKRLSG